MRARPAVFLDRDGTLIDNAGYLGEAAAVRALPGVAEAVQALRARGWPCIVATNQSGVARGLFTVEEYREVERATAAAVGGVDASYACFHLPREDGGEVAPFDVPCGCRKPLPGLLLAVAERHDVDLARSVFVGDDVRDADAAIAAGVEPLLVRTGKGVRSEQTLAAAGRGDVRVFDDLAAVADALGHPPATSGPDRTAPVVTDRSRLAALVARARDRGAAVVLANGCFDLLHAGHVRYLRAARREGDLLVVALNTDASVRRNKGEGRPLQCESDRAEIVAALGCVDLVTTFDEPTADALLLALRPDVHAKGTDWRAEDVPEAATVAAIGGRVAIVGDVKTRSSTEIAQRARRAEGA